MAIVGLLHLTSLVNSSATAQTPATHLISHLSDLYPTQTHDPFNLDHRLFVSTSSLLPQIDSKRTFTHLFTSSHVPQKTYIGTTSSTASGSTESDASQVSSRLSIITIPTATSLEPFTALLNQKLQPQWAARQFLVSDNGASIALPITDNARWSISISDLRLPHNRVSGSAAGQLRGVLIEVQHEDADNVDAISLDGEEQKKKYQALFRALLKGLFKDIKLDLKLDDAKIYLTATSSGKGNVEQSEEKSKQKQQHPGSEVAELYMEVLRGSRG